MNTYFEQLILPMVKVNDGSVQILKQIIAQRISEHVFFQEGVLSYCVTKSGGNPRQLLSIVLEALKISRGQQISRPTAERAVHQLGQQLYEGITIKHLEALKTRPYLTGEQTVQELLVFLRLLKYNGVIEINPLLDGFIDHTG